MSIVVEPLSLPTLKRVSKALEQTTPPIRVAGVHSCVAFSLLFLQDESRRMQERPHVVVFPDDASAKEFISSIQFYDPSQHVYFLPSFDVGIYSNLYPSARIIAQRIRWLHFARNSLPGQIFVTTTESLLQQTLPYSIFARSSLILELGSELPADFTKALQSLGYIQTPTVEDVGTYSLRGGIIDIFSPENQTPYRIELFGDVIESLRTFDPQTQISLGPTNQMIVLPAREVLYTDDNRQLIIKKIQLAAQGRSISKDELDDIIRSVSHGQPFYGADFLLPYFYSQLDSPLNYFSQEIDLWFYDHLDTLRHSDLFNESLKSEYEASQSQVLRVDYKDLYASLDKTIHSVSGTVVYVDRLAIGDAKDESAAIDFKSVSIADFKSAAHASSHDTHQLAQFIKDRVGKWRANNYTVFICSTSGSVRERLRLIFEKADFTVRYIEENNYSWTSFVSEQAAEMNLIHFIPRYLPDGFRLPEENIIFIRDEDIFGKRRIHLSAQTNKDALERSEALSFGDLKIGDFVVHKIHGIGIYLGLKPMQIEGADAEFIELQYKDKDKLYLPVYRVGQLNKYVGPSSLNLIDKLGGTGWLKTKTKVKNQLRDVADNLLKLYAKRAQVTRAAFAPPDSDYFKFENSFSYQETEDQLRAINDILGDLEKDQPMDRLICGDVGFGKTEVAMRATFRAVNGGRQVAILAPTTILTHQHYQNFKKRFAQSPVEIRALNRFISAKDVKKTLQDLKEGKVDIIIGTHRLLSKDVKFKNLGLLVIDEEQKFGVVHKERLRQMREAIDTLAMSATPIPRTLNMSLVGIRDLSIINTPPEDRLPTRTFVCKYDTDTVRKAIESEISRGGQIFFLHNRVQTIEEAAAKVRAAVPSARIAIAHGQMDESLLEKTMIRFYNHELDVLVCSAIIESGMDIPRANTIFIDNAHTFGVGQLYQLRGRVGRSKERAYCYLLLPPEKRIDKIAQERLQVIQENTALGSGLKVAQYDLELRGTGDILGEDQSGHINAVGYELYMELLDNAVHELRGDPPKDETLEPEINLRVPALLPDKYIPDIRMRLYYYKCLSNVRSIEDIEKIEDELRDQFGAPPEPVLNLMGLMLVRKICRELGVKDISSGKSILSLAFTEKTPLPPEQIVRLTAKENKKYQLAPDQKLKIRMKDISLARVVDELEYLKKLCP